MAIANSHSHNVPSTSSAPIVKMLRALAEDLERDPLAMPPQLYIEPRARIAAVLDFALNGEAAELDARELGYLARLGA